MSTPPTSDSDALVAGRPVAIFARPPLMFLDDDAVVVDRGLPGLWRDKYASRKFGAVAMDLPGDAGGRPMEFVYSHQAVERIWDLSARFEMLWFTRVIGTWIRDSLAPAIGLPALGCTPDIEAIRYADRHPIGAAKGWWKEVVVRDMISQDRGRRFVWLDSRFTSPVLARMRAELSDGQSALIPIQRGRGIDDRAMDLIYRFEEDGRAHV